MLTILGFDFFLFPRCGVFSPNVKRYLNFLFHQESNKRVLPQIRVPSFTLMNCLVPKHISHQNPKVAAEGRNKITKWAMLICQ